MSATQISQEVIEKFLSGSDDQKYIVAIEATYNQPFATLVINDPINNKKHTEKHPYKPFLWFKQDITTLMYEGKRLKIIEACKKYGIKITALRINADDGTIPKKLEDGYRYMATCKKTYNDLINFFKEGGIDVWDKQFSKMFLMFSPAEQFMIQSGKRLFKGMDDYDDIHRLQFDLETEGLLGSKHCIFQIGIRDNRGFETILEITGNTPQERRDSERFNLQKFFKIIDMLKPDVITGFNSEAFDWQFIYDRCEKLFIPVTDLAITLDNSQTIKRKDGMIKLGGESEPYKQTSMYGYNIIDICHSVRRAMAINSDIQSWSLKYITKYSKIAKPNRVYIKGDDIYKIWADVVNDYAYNETNGDWWVINEKRPFKENSGYKITKGAEIVRQYLLDDLWETEKIDYIYNQATFLIAKILPTTYQRASTMGTSGQWKLIMSAWSYENGLAIPATESKRDFTGGLSRLLEVGYAHNVVKFDFAALYPKTELTHNIFPPLDITGAMKGLLTYVVDTRDKYKFLAGKHKKLVKKLKEELELNKSTYSIDKINELNKAIEDNTHLETLYDKKQLPLKILANSWFGSYGAPYIFNWGETDCAEETTCRGRQYLRLMVKHFTEKYGFRPLVGDTDGFNFAVPEHIKDFKYKAIGNHWKTEENAGVELMGLEAVLAEFNEKYMIGKMGLDIDDICTSTINFARKNYANLIDGKVKLVGNSIKSKKMATYIEEFLHEGIRLLLEGKGYEFIESYYEYVNKIYNYNIPLVKIASKSKVKTTMSEYKKKATQKNKAGNPMPKQAHMELAVSHGLDVNYGDVIYYVNVGKTKSHGDLKSVKNADGKVEVQLNCKLINNSTVESDTESIKELEQLKAQLNSDKEPISDADKIIIENRIMELESSLSTHEYNVAKYLAAFNKKLEPLMVCFHPDIRHNILINIKKQKKEKGQKESIEKLQERSVFTKDQCQLVSGMPLTESSQDDYHKDLMTMEDKEIKFWDKVNMVPNNMELDEWVAIKTDYKERLRIAKEEGIKQETNFLRECFKRLEISELIDIKDKGTLPLNIFVIADVGFDEHSTPKFISRKWESYLCDVSEMFIHEDEAIERNKFYQDNNIMTFSDKYESWVAYKAETLMLTGETIDINYLSNNKLKDITNLMQVKNEDVMFPVEHLKTKKVKPEDDEEEEDEEEDENKTKEEADDFAIELQKNAYLDDVAIHIPSRPNIKVYPTHVPIVKQISSVVDEEKDDDWNF